MLISHILGGEGGQVKCHTSVNHSHLCMHLIVPQTRSESLLDRNGEARTAYSHSLLWSIHKPPDTELKRRHRENGA